MLHIRELIPPLTIRESHGNLIRAWDLKQKQNLVLAFLDAGCPLCQAFIRDLGNHSVDLREKGAVTLLVFPKQPEQSTGELLSDGMFAGAFTSAHDVREFLGQDALSLQRLCRRAIFVTDRYGEIAGLWTTQEHEFPRIEQILSSLNLVEIACEECSVPFWPVDE